MHACKYQDLKLVAASCNNSSSTQQDALRIVTDIAIVGLYHFVSIHVSYLQVKGFKLVPFCQLNYDKERMFI